VNTINLTNDIKLGMLKAISDIGLSCKQSVLPIDKNEIDEIINDTIDYINGGK
tara:strand:+ start:205 stop:363 length:159 start_codon:yes stop_codon:yes gene_type:complete